MTLEILELAAHFDLGSFRRSHVELRFAVLECRDPVSEAETRKSWMPGELRFQQGPRTALQEGYFPLPRLDLFGCIWSYIGKLRP